MTAMTDDDVVCPRCEGAGCGACGFAGVWIRPEPDWDRLTCEICAGFGCDACDDLDAVLDGHYWDEEYES